LAQPLPLLLAICALGMFVGIQWATIHRTLGAYADVYWVGLGIVVICAYARGDSVNPLIGVIQAFLAPLAGSIVGYTLLTATLYLAHGHVNRGVEFHEWLVAATIFSYYGVDGWILTLALMAHPLLVWIVHG
jgi:hypothetical protein